MKKIVIVLLCFALLVCSGCSFRGSINYTLTNGEKFSVDFTEDSYSFKMGLDRNFVISKSGKKIADVCFVENEKAFPVIHKEEVLTKNAEEIFEEGTKDGYPYISYSYYKDSTLKYCYMCQISDNSSMLFETDISQEVLKDCFESITVTIQ